MGGYVVYRKGGFFGEARPFSPIYYYEGGAELTIEQVEADFRSYKRKSLLSRLLRRVEHWEISRVIDL